jgi:phosphatidate phosphatase APP1
VTISVLFSIKGTGSAAIAARIFVLYWSGIGAAGTEVSGVKVRSRRMKNRAFSRPRPITFISSLPVTVFQPLIHYIRKIKFPRMRMFIN